MSESYLVAMSEREHEACRRLVQMPFLSEGLFGSLGLQASFSWFILQMRKDRAAPSLRGDVDILACPLSWMDPGAFDAVLRQNSMRTENSAILCLDGCPVSVIPSPSGQSLPEERPLGIHVYIRMEECGRFRDATLVRIRQPDRTGGAALRVAHEKECDPRLWRKFCRSALPSRVQGACGPRGSSGHTRRGVASDGVHRAR
jgi:hypothetical protein